jgi:hypothetical protein
VKMAKQASFRLETVFSDQKTYTQYAAKNCEQNSDRHWEATV